MFIYDVRSVLQCVAVVGGCLFMTSGLCCSVTMCGHALQYGPAAPPASCVRAGLCCSVTINGHALQYGSATPSASCEVPAVQKYIRNRFQKLSKSLYY